MGSLKKIASNTIEGYCKQIKCYKCNKPIDDYFISVDTSRFPETIIVVEVYCHGKNETMKFTSEFKDQILQNDDKVEAGYAFIENKVIGDIENKVIGDTKYIT